LNNVYRIVWNAARAAWQVVGEIGSRRGKTRDRKERPVAATSSRILLAGGLLLAGPAVLAMDLPTGGQVTVGSGRIDTSQNAMTITQDSDRLAINWEQFSIGENASVQFLQPTETAIALNRVLGSDVSTIQGALTANGRVFLINPNGVLFSESAMVDVGGLVASTLGISDEDFANGRFVFEGDSAAAVVNRGSLAADGGFVALVAARVENVGTITADDGSVLMGAGSRVRLDLGGPVKIEVEEAALDALIEQGGAIRADGGTVLLTAKAAGDLTNTVINHTGISEARTLEYGCQRRDSAARRRRRERGRHAGCVGAERRCGRIHRDLWRARQRGPRCPCDNAGHQR
jgi:filamentous hemagglutinin family protein